MKTFVVAYVAAALLGFSAIAAFGQTQPEPTTAYSLEIFAPGVNPATGAPIIVAGVWAVDSVTCGQPKVPPPTSPVVNPTRVLFDDPANTNADCELPVSASNYLFSVPLGTGYVGTIKALGTTLSSQRSAPSNPFGRAATVVAPNVVSGVRVIR